MEPGRSGTPGQQAAGRPRDGAESRVRIACELDVVCLDGEVEQQVLDGDQVAIPFRMRAGAPRAELECTDGVHDLHEPLIKSFVRLRDGEGAEAVVRTGSGVRACSMRRSHGSGERGGAGRARSQRLRCEEGAEVGDRRGAGDNTVSESKYKVLFRLL